MALLLMLVMSCLGRADRGDFGLGGIEFLLLLLLLLLLQYSILALLLIGCFAAWVLFFIGLALNLIEKWLACLAKRVTKDDTEMRKPSVSRFGEPEPCPGDARTIFFFFFPLAFCVFCDNGKQKMAGRV